MYMLSTFEVKHILHVGMPKIREKCLAAYLWLELVEPGASSARRNRKDLSNIKDVVL